MTMQFNTVGAGGTAKETIRTLNRSIGQAQRKADRYIRLFHRAKVEDIKTHWFDLAVLHNAHAANAARHLSEVLEKERSGSIGSQAR